MKAKKIVSFTLAGIFMLSCAMGCSGKPSDLSLIHILCITILNPYSENKMYIDLEEEFTLSYGAYHEHFYPDRDGYNEMVKTINGILDNELCSATMYSGQPLKWLGSTAI